MPTPLSARPLGTPRRRPVAVVVPRARPPAHPAWVVGGAVAVHLALVVAPWVLAYGVDGVRWGALSILAPLAMIYGLWRQSPWALLVGVPLGWALPAHGLPTGAFDGAVGLVALLAVAAYIPTALGYLRPRDAAIAEISWTALDAEAGEAPRRRWLPWLAAVVAAGPAVGVALWPGASAAVARGFAGVAGRAHVAFVLMALLVGLALATDLARGRAALRGSRRRAMVLAVVGAIAALGGVLLAR